MATIATTSNAAPFIYPSTTLLARDPTTGYLYCMIKASTADNYTIYRSINGGTSWASFLNLVRTNVVEIGSIFVHSEGWLYWVYRTNESSQDRIYFRRASLTGSGSWQAELNIATVGNGGAAGAIYAGMDLTVIRTPSAGHFICIAAGTNSGATHGITAFGVTINPTTGIPVLNNGIITGNRLWLYTGSGRITPSIDLEHIGNGEGAGSPNAWIAFGRTTLYMVKMAWSGAGWSGPGSSVTIASSITAADSIAGRWDGSRWLMAIQNPASTSTVNVYERNQANSSTIVRTTGTHPTGVVRNCTLAYSATSGDIRVYAVGTSTTVLYYADFIRATGIWSGWTQVLATAVLGTTGDNYGARRNSYADARYSVYTAHAASSTIHTLQTLSYAPSTPTWTTAGLAYVDGGAADVAATLVLDWIFSDPDITDTQGWFAISRQIGAGALAYWRASDSTWQVAEVQNASSGTSVTLPAAWGVDGAAAHVYKVKVWDAGGVASGYSAALTVLPSAKVNPTITSPAAAAVITADSVTTTWTVAEQTAVRVRLWRAGLMYYNGTYRTTTDLSYLIPALLEDNTAYMIGVTTKNNDGLPSTEITVNFTVDYVEPAIPTLVCTPVPASGWIAVAITNPAPTGGQPALAYNDLYRRETAVGGEGVRVAIGLTSGATCNDWFRVASNTPYEYRVRAFGANGTNVYSAWTA